MAKGCLKRTLTYLIIWSMQKNLIKSVIGIKFTDRRTKLSKIKETTFLFIITIIFFSFGVVGNIAAADPVKVLILPFTINSDKDLSFLRKGVADMLSSRLALKDQIVVIDKTDPALNQEQIPEEITAETALALGERTQSNYVLFGNIGIKKILKLSNFLTIFKI